MPSQDNGVGDCAEVGVIVKTKAAVLWELNAPWSIEEIDLDPPGPNEVLVKLVASGMCHSDEHLHSLVWSLPEL
jgi:Zn-dependent alcohol dehydrogenase